MSVKDKLRKLSKGELITLVNDLSDNSGENLKYIKSELASNEPVKLANLLEKEISMLSKRAHMYDYYQSEKVSNIIYDIINKVEKHLITKAPDLAVGILQKLIAIDHKLFDHIDDSYGNLGTAYYSLFEILDKAFANSSFSAQDIATYVVKTYIDDEYGNRSDILRQINTSLAGDKSIELNKIVESSNIDTYEAREILKKAADLSNDVDKYIKAIDSREENIRSQDVCDVSERLIKAARYQEAREWLSRIEGDEYNSDKRDKLLLDSYQNEGNILEAQKIRWKIFEKHFDYEVYNLYIKYLTDSEKFNKKQEAIELAKKTNLLSFGVSFLVNIKEYDEVEELILSRYDDVSEGDYYTYRKLSTDLAKKGKYLVATLLRRKITEGCVKKAQSKYYRYAASDYKKCGEFAAKVTDWQHFDNHESYISAFQEDHKRKKAFWSLVSK